MSRPSRAHLIRRAHSLRAEGQSYPQIAAALGISVGSAHAYCKAQPPAAEPNIQTDDGKPVAGVGEGNTIAVRHGAYAPQLVSAQAEALRPSVLQHNPHLHEGRDGPAIARYLQTLARVARVYEWLEQQADPVFADTTAGALHGVYDQLRRWERDAASDEERLGIAPLTRAKLGLTQARGHALVAHLQEKYGQGVAA